LGTECYIETNKHGKTDCSHCLSIFIIQFKTICRAITRTSKGHPHLPELAHSFPCLHQLELLMYIYIYIYRHIYLHMLIYENIQRSLTYGILYGFSALESEGCMSLRNAGKLPATHSHIPEDLNCEFCTLFVTKVKIVILQRQMDMSSQIPTLVSSFWD